MRNAIAALLLAASLIAATGMAPANADLHKDLGKNLTENYIRPATVHFSNAAAALTGALEFLCREPDSKRESFVHSRFNTLVNSWFRIQFLRFGPMVEDNRFERIFFWPDPRGVTLRQVQDVLSGYDRTAINPDQLAEKSVALQGLLALEYALYGTGAEGIVAGSPEGRYRCAYALAVSQRLTAVAAELAEAWSSDGSFAYQFMFPGPDNDLYRNDEEVAAEAIKAMVTGLTFVSDAIITPFVAKEPENANHKRAPFWRSGLTIPAIRNAMDGLHSFYTETGFAEALDETDTWIDGGLQLELRNVATSLERIDMPLEEAVMPGPGRETLIYVVIALKSLHTTIEGRLAQAVGVAVGFNALDGD